MGRHDPYDDASSLSSPSRTLDGPKETRVSCCVGSPNAGRLANVFEPASEKVLNVRVMLNQGSLAAILQVDAVNVKAAVTSDDHYLWTC